MPAARLVIRERVVYEDGALVSMVVWRVPSPVTPSRHDLKYSLVYIVEGERVLGYDNERRKGDHGHFRGTETPYKFTTIEKRLADFAAEVEMLRRKSV